MTARFTQEHLDRWRHDGGVLIDSFFTPAEVAEVVADFEAVFGRSRGGAEALVTTQPDEIGRFDASQFATFEAIPFDCSPALNLIGVHPALVALARAALETEHVHLYQCQAWAKYAGDADYDQPFHTDFVNHTLTVPSEDALKNSITVLCYFSDVTESHGPMHFVTRPDSHSVAGPEAALSADPKLQEELKPFARSSAATAGSVFPYGIDVFHRGTNITVPGGHRFAVMACFKAAGNDAIGYHAWPFHHTKPWHRVFEHATPEQLACFGVPLPGDPFWTEITVARAAARYPSWDLAPYRTALGSPATGPG